jgi:DNA-3-methyladenine glycosylase II
MLRETDESTRLPRALTRAVLQQATRQLTGRDPDLAAVVARLGPPPLWGRRPGFPTLVRIILEQQVSLAAARTLYRKVRRNLGGMAPAQVHAAQVSGLRGLGLTRQKAVYCHGLAAAVLSGGLDLGALARGRDDAGRQALLALPGIGPWSADIYYLMALRRPDVWPQGDLALAAALRDLKALGHHPDAAAQERLTRTWRPWRAVAARILWMHYLAARNQYPVRAGGAKRSGRPNKIK